MICIGEGIEYNTLVDIDVLTFDQQEGGSSRPKQNSGAGRQDTRGHCMASAVSLVNGIANRYPFTVDRAHAVDRKVELPGSPHVPLLLCHRHCARHARAIRYDNLIVHS